MNLDPPLLPPLLVGANAARCWIWEVSTCRGGAQDVPARQAHAVAGGQRGGGG